MDTTNTDISTERFANLELDIDGAPPAPEPEPAPAIPGKTINEGGRRAAAAERQMVADVTGMELSGEGSGALGFSGGGTGLVYDEGTTMLAEGVAVALAGRDEWDELPTAKKALAEHVARIGAEERLDFRSVNLSDLRVDEDGILTGVDGGLRFTEGSFSQLRSDAPNSATVRGNLNSWLGKSKTVRTLRTRYPANGTRQLFATLSDKYAIADGAEILEVVAGELPGETRARVSYDPETTRLSADLTLQNPYEFEDDIAVGRLHRFGIRLTTRDDGRGRIRMKAYAERIACINCTLIPMDWAHLAKSHVGDVSEIIKMIHELAQKAGHAMSEFADHWRAAHVTRVFNDSYTADDARAAFEKLVEGGFVNVKTDDVAVVDKLVTAWRVEPGNTYQAINRAITRAAHADTWKVDADTEALEEQAGQLLYNRVMVCNALDWAQA